MKISKGEVDGPERGFIPYVWAKYKCSKKGKTLNLRPVALWIDVFVLELHPSIIEF